ncbi:MAG: spirocyclase AveC family protein [Solirubrobacteraceae bacterium]
MGATSQAPRLPGSALAGDEAAAAASDAVATPQARRMSPAIKVWATLGALVLAFEAYVLIRWVSGPYFKHVAPGPTPEPGWMRAAENTWQVAGILATIGIVYWFVVRPWRREGKPTTDGLLVCAFATLWFEDPLSAYTGHWFTYNANLVNFGSWVKDVPGWSSYGAPGRMVLEPLLMIPFVYVYFIMIGTLVGCATMRAAERRWNLSTIQLIGVCFLTMCVLDLIGEGLIFLPLGFWEYPGGYGMLFPSTYHKYPVNEMLTIGALFTLICCLRYFKNDRGQTLVERGVDRITTSERSKLLLRFLALAAAVHLSLFVAYNLPNSWVGMHSRPWPADLQKRSYLTDGLCGAGTQNACPGPGVPLIRGNATAHLGPNGQLVVPADVKLPKLIPFAHR